MRLAQAAMSSFLPLIAWQRFRRETQVARAPGYHAFACGDAKQAIVWPSDVAVAMRTDGSTLGASFRSRRHRARAAR